jgi:hypothetical protein
VVPKEKLEEETFLIAKSVATIPSVQTSIVKRFMNNYYDGQMGLRVYQDSAEGIESFKGWYLGTETEWGTRTWRLKQMERGLSYALRERDRPFEDLDRWWREKLAARPKFETGRLERDWKKIAEEQKKKAEELAKKEKE